MPAGATTDRDMIVRARRTQAWLAGTLAASVIGATVPAAAHASASFSTTDYPLAGSPEGFAVGDVDNKDGPDLVAISDTSSTAGNLEVRLNDGDGNFGPAVDYPTCDADQVELADVTNGSGLTPDGNLDAIVYCLNTGTLAVMAGNGMGGFGTPQYLPVHLNSPSINYDAYFAVGIFDPDSALPSIVYRTKDPNNNEDFCYMDGNEQTSACELSAPDGESPTISGPMVPVYFVNGQQQLLTLGLPNDTTENDDIVIWTEDGTDYQQWSPTELPFGQSLGQNNLVAAGDLNGDSQPDIITSSSTSSSGVLNTTLATGSGGWAAPQSYPSIPDIRALLTGDFDQDGHTDVLAVGGYGEAALQAGDGTGGLGTPQTIPLLGDDDVVQAAEADIDGNGTPDAVILDDTLGTFEVLRNLTPPRAATTTPAPTEPGPAPTLPPPPPPPANPVGVRVNLPALAGVTKLQRKVLVTHTFGLTVGEAKNPPTGSVSLTLTVPKPGAGKTHHAARSAGAARRVKRIVLARSTVTVPAGGQAPLVLRLNRAGRQALGRDARISATLTLVATSSSGGATQTRTWPLTVTRAAPKRVKAKTAQKPGAEPRGS
jgi:hypothetical protein